MEKYKKKQTRLLGVLAASLACLPCFCYSEGITPYYGYTGNAAATGNTWNMTDVLPTPPGLDINSVIYQYTAKKLPSDAMTVDVQNENANGTGYIFKQTDNWSGLPGNTINKVIGVGGIPRSYWGTGSIQVTGEGTVEDARVVYTYKVDPCFDPQSNPSCPGYKPVLPPLPEIQLYDATKDNIVLDATKETDDKLYKKKKIKEETEDEKKEEKKRKERLEKALAAAGNALQLADAVAQTQILESMNMSVNMTSYYAASIKGGVYKETISLVDKKLPENKLGLRNGLAQQILHDKMIELQYSK